MRKNLLILIFLFFAYSIKAQIPNAGFEDWNSSGLPDQYLSYNFSFQSNDSHSGAYAILLQTRRLKNNTGIIKDSLAGFVVTGGLGKTGYIKGFPYTDKPTTFSGYYKSTIPTGDTAYIAAILFKFNPQTNQRDTVGSAFFYSITTEATYTLFIADFYYTALKALPDTAMVVMSSSIKNIIPGANLLVDDLMFDGITATSTALAAELISAFPNPSNDELTITSIPTSAFQIEVRDLSGKLIQQITPAKTVQVNLTTYPAGMYYYAVRTKDNIILHSDKFVVVK